MSWFVVGAGTGRNGLPDLAILVTSYREGEGLAVLPLGELADAPAGPRGEITRCKFPPEVMGNVDDALLVTESGSPSCSTLGSFSAGVEDLTFPVLPS